VTSKLAAFVCAKLFRATQSHSNKLSISNSFLLFATENIYFLSVNGSVGISDIDLERLEITELQNTH
jgi:hypothetical protein